MTSAAFVLLGIVCGSLVWRGSHKILDAVFAGACLPPAGVIIFGAAIGRDAMLGLPPWAVALGATIAIGAVSFFQSLNKGDFYAVPKHTTR